MQFVLVSSCLLGSPVRYNGAHKFVDCEVLQRWLAQGRVIPVCPEVLGGLPVPRPPAEIATGVGGGRVLASLARVVDLLGNDVSAEFIAGAQKALQKGQLNGVRLAVLKEGSPSCGSSYIHDGTFTGNRVPNSGVAAALLERAGIKVFSENQFVQADEFLVAIENPDATR